MLPMYYYVGSFFISGIQTTKIYTFYTPSFFQYSQSYLRILCRELIFFYFYLRNITYLSIPKYHFFNLY